MILQKVLDRRDPDDTGTCPVALVPFHDNIAQNTARCTTHDNFPQVHIVVRGDPDPIQQSARNLDNAVSVAIKNVEHLNIVSAPPHTDNALNLCNVEALPGLGSSYTSA